MRTKYSLYRLVNIERRGKTIYLISRAADLRRVIFSINDFFPYLYIKRDTPIPSDLRNLIHIRSKGKWKTLENGSMDKVYTKLPDDVREIRDKLSNDLTAEADIIYTTRFLIDKKINSGYFTLRDGKKGTQSSDSLNSVKISHEDVIPIDPPFTIPAREAQLDIEAVNDKTVLIGWWDSYSNHYYSVAWKKGHNEVYEDTYASWNPADKYKRTLILPRTVYIMPSAKTMFDLAFGLIKQQQIDVLSGWAIHFYDMPEMFKQSMKYGSHYNILSPFRSAPVPEKIKGLALFDQLWGFKKIEARQLRSYKLPNVAKEKFGIKVPSDPPRIPEMYHVDIKTLIDYNSSHVDTCRLLSTELDIIEFVYQLVCSCCCRFDDVEGAMRLVDSLMLSVKSENVVYPNKKYGLKTDKAKGAKVFDPVVGRHGLYTLVYDASRLYPTIMLWFNMGIETLDPNGTIKVPLTNEWGEVIDTVRFTNKKKSELGKVFEVLFGLRDKYEAQLNEELNKQDKNKDFIKLKKKQIFSTKTNTNAVYGNVGNPAFRLFKQIIQECITQVGRDTVEHIDDEGSVYGEELGINSKVVYGDTDSIHLYMEFKTLKEAIEHGIKLEAIINNSFDEFVKPYGLKTHGFKVKLEAIAEGALYKSKKRYAFKHVWEDGHVLDEPNYKIVGLEPKRSDSPEITEEVMTKVLKMILNKATIKEIDEYVDVEYTKIVEHKYTPFEIGIPKGINKKLSDYFYGKCRVKKLKGGTVGCGYIEPGVLPFTDKEEYQNRRQYCPKCGNKLTYTKPIHAFAADYSNNYLDTDLKGGTKTRYLYVKGTGRYPPTHVVALDEDLKLPKDFKVDYVMQARKIVLDKISPLTDLIKVSKQTKLG